MSSFRFIRKHKSLFAILFLLQLLFLVSVNVILAAFTPVIINNASSIMESVSSIDITRARYDIIQQKLPLSDASKVNEQYRKVQQSTFLMLFFLAISYVLVHACIWHLLKRRFFLRTICLVFFQSIGWVLLVLSSSVVMLYSEINGLLTIPLMCISLATLYFVPLMLVQPEPSFKKSMKRALALGINHFPGILLVYGMVALVYLIVGLLLFFAYNLHILLFAFVVLLSIVVIAWTKVFLYTELSELV